MICIRLVLAILFLSSWAFGQFQLSTCAIFKNEAPFLKEWIEFHKLQGCEHFYLYNNNSTDNFLDVLEPYLTANEATLIDWPYTYPYGDHKRWIAIQTSAYRDCIKNFGKENVWIAFFDIDEFLFSPLGKKLPTVLEQYFQGGVVRVFWRVFGTSGVEDLAEHQCLIEALTRCSELNCVLNQWFKSIVRPDCVINCISAHEFVLKENCYATLFDRRPGKNSNVTTCELFLNHYWLRTEKYLREYKISSEAARKRSDALKYKNLCDRCQDTTILQFVPALRQALGYDKIKTKVADEKKLSLSQDPMCKKNHARKKGRAHAKDYRRRKGHHFISAISSH
jgi:hypothetical protein